MAMASCSFASVHADGKTATLFAINHRLPAPELRPRAHEIGADSVIEVFTTTLGSDELRWVRTLEHPLINTPNNLGPSERARGWADCAVAISETQLFLTNDHKCAAPRRVAELTRADKIHILRRKAEAIWDLPSSIVYCDLGAGAATSPDCKISATTIYPNGITRGPENTLWQASSTGGEANHWEWDAEYNLHKLDSVKLCVRALLTGLTMQQSHHGQHQCRRRWRGLYGRTAQATLTGQTSRRSASAFVP